MKYIVRVLSLAAIALVGFFVAAPDHSLAYVDHRLAEVSRAAGNPAFLRETRNAVHTFRYARSSAASAVKTRIVRKGEPAQVRAAPTPVVQASAYQFGRMPSALQKSGVIGQNNPVVAQRAARVRYAEGFEFKFAGHLTRDFAAGWTGYTVWGEPTSDADYATRHSGGWSQKISGHASFRGGIYRRFATYPGMSYNVRVFAHLYELGGGAVHIGVDPWGGVDASAASVRWFPQATRLGEWLELNASGYSGSNVLTVFLEGYSLYGDNTNAYFDDFSLETFVPA